MKSPQANNISWTQYSEPAETVALNQQGTGQLALWYRPPVAEWKQDCERKLNSFAEYNFDNWDDAGSKAISLGAYVGAFYLLGRLIKNLDLPQPNVIPGFKGDIVFLWARKGVELKISVGPAGKFILTEKNMATGAVEFSPELGIEACMELADLKFYNII